MGIKLNDISNAFNGCSSLTNLNVDCVVADDCKVDNFITNTNTTITFKQKTNRDSIQEILQGCPWQIEEIYDGITTTTETYSGTAEMDINVNIMEAESKTLELQGNTLQNLIINPNNEEETANTITRDCLLSPNVSYTVYFNVNKSCTLNLGGNTVQVSPTEFQKVITTPSTLSHNQLIITGADITANNLMVIRDDYSNKKIGYFEGMESVGVWDDSKNAYKLKINTTPSTIGNIEDIEGLSNYWVFNDYSKVKIYNDGNAASQYFTVSPIVGNNVFTSDTIGNESRPYSTILSKSFTEDGFKDMTNTQYYNKDFWTEYPFSNNDEFTVSMSFSVESDSETNKYYFRPFALSTYSNMVYFPDRVGWVEPESEHSYLDFLKLNQMNSFIYVSTPNYCAFYLNGNLMASSTATRRDLSAFNKCNINLNAQDKPTVNSVSFYKRVLSENEIINLANKYSKVSTKTFYLPCQLNKIIDKNGTVLRDKLYWDEAKGFYCIEQNVQMKILDGSEDWRVAISFIPPSGYYGYELSLPSGFKNYQVTLSSYYGYSYPNTNDAICVADGLTWIINTNTGLSTVDLLKEYLSNNPITVYYPINAKIIELQDYDVNFGKLRLYGENTNISTNGIAKPTAITFDHLEV